MYWVPFVCALAAWVISVLVNGKLVALYSEFVAEAEGVPDPSQDSAAVASWFFHATDFASCIPSVMLTAVSWILLPWEHPELAAAIILAIAAVPLVALLVKARDPENAAVYIDYSMRGISVISALVFVANAAGLVAALCAF